MSDENKKSENLKREQEEAREEMKEFEQRDELPADLSEWPSGKAKYVTFGSDSDEPFGEGPTSKLGPGSLERHEDGSVSIDGEQVDNPDDYKAEPVPGGPTDPDATPLPGEERAKEKRATKSE